MKKVASLCVLLIVLHSPAQSQSVNSIVGKWRFERLYQTGGMDSIGIQMLNQIFGDVWIYLKENKHYKSDLRTKDEGGYQYDESTKKLTLVSNKGNQSELEASVFEKDSLLLNFGEDRSVVLAKVAIDPEDELEESVSVPSLVSISTNQLCKKWFFVKRYVPNKTEAQLQMISDLFKGTYFMFNKNNSYSVQIGKIGESGTWKLSNDNKTLTLTVNGETKIWNIKKVSDSELELIKGTSEEYWTFSVNR